MGNAPKAENEHFEWSGPDITEDYTQPLGVLLLERLRKHAKTLSNPSQIDGVTGVAKSWSDLLREVVQAAAGFRSLGISANDAIAIFSRNNHYKYHALIGAVLEGVTVATFTPSFKQEELRQLLSCVTAKAVVCEPENLEVALQAVPQGTIIFVTTDSVGQRREGVYSIADLLNMGSGVNVDTYQAADVGDTRKHAISVVFSSGSSGLPKGVAISNRGMTANVMCLRGWSVIPTDVVLVTSPVSWVTGLSYTFIPIILGATRVLYRGKSDAELLDTIVKYKVSMAFLSPARFILLASLVKTLRQKGVSVDLSHFRIGTAAGAPLTAEMQKMCSELVVPIVQLYGSTEQLLICADTFPPHYGLAGKPQPGVRIRLIDAATGRCIREANKEGEVHVKTAGFMIGYINDPKNSAEAKDEDGWYRSGDLAIMDEEGRIHITGRIKEMLKYMNIQITPAEVESVLMTHPAVKNACVVGRVHDVVGDLPTAFVELVSGKKITEMELQDLVVDRLSYEKRLSGGVFFVDEIPLSSNGKTDRKVIQARLSTLPPVSDQAIGLIKA